MVRFEHYTRISGVQQIKPLEIIGENVDVK